MIPLRLFEGRTRIARWGNFLGFVHLACLHMSLGINETLQL
jgi:hypothetical protein